MENVFERVPVTVLTGYLGAGKQPYSIISSPTTWEAYRGD